MTLLALLSGLSACGPVSVQQAEEQCFQPARQAGNPLAGSTVGFGTEGLNTDDLEFTITSDFVQGRDPAAVYDACVFNKSGQMPTRPLYDRPDYRG